MVRKHKKILIALLVLVCIYAVDFTLVSFDKRPIFVVSGQTIKDGGTKEYYGLGYKVIGWRCLEVKNINGVEVCGRLTGYELSIFPFFQDVNDGPRKELKFVPND